jgi:DNA-binding NarL/FixJ family response regulator
MPPGVYVLEPQLLFVPDLVETIEEAGGSVVRTAPRLDRREIGALQAEYAFVDLDYTPPGVLGGLAAFRIAAPNVRVILLTGEHGPDWLERCRAAGAWAVLSKAMRVIELRRALERIFTGEAVSDPRVNAA